MVSSEHISTYYPFNPSHVLPIIFAVLIGLSLLLHVWQNFHHRSWKLMFFMIWGGLVFTTGWILRATSSYHVANRSLYIAQYVFVLSGPPIYSAAEYKVLGRLMLYLPMHAPLNPNRVIYFFIYLGALVESLTTVGGTKLSAAGDDKAKQRSGGTLIIVSVALQAVVEIIFMAMVAMLHYRCTRAGMLTRKVRTLCIMLYGTSTLVLIRCIFRAVENISIVNILISGSCDGLCDQIIRHEWYLYALEAAPMVIYTYWLNFIHPGRFLPQRPNVYLDASSIERVGPGWIDRRSTWATFVDPVDLSGLISGKPAHEKFWLQPEIWPTLSGGKDGHEMDTVAAEGAKPESSNPPLFSHS